MSVFFDRRVGESSSLSTPSSLAGLLADLRRRGITLSRADGAGIRITPASRLTDADRAAIRAHREGLLDLLQAEQADVSPPPAPDTAPPVDPETAEHILDRLRADLDAAAASYPGGQFPDLVGRVVALWRDLAEDFAAGRWHPPPPGVDPTDWLREYARQAVDAAVGVQAARAQAIAARDYGT